MASGATVAQLEKRFFNGVGVQGDSRSEEMATEVLAEKEAEVSRALRSLNVNPDLITEGGAPDAYSWRQETVLYGAAAEFVRRRPSSEVPAVAGDWTEEFRRRLTELAANPRLVLGDAPVWNRSGTGTKHSFV